MDRIKLIQLLRLVLIGSTSGSASVLSVTHSAALVVPGFFSTYEGEMADNQGAVQSPCPKPPIPNGRS